MFGSMENGENGENGEGSDLGLRDWAIFWDFRAFLLLGISRTLQKIRISKMK